MIAQIHIARKDLGLDEENYRAVLVGATGKDSCKAMSGVELNRAVDRMRDLGWKPMAGKAKQKLSPKTRDKRFANQVDKIRALWINAYRLGAVKNRYESGLNAFVKRMTKVERVDWLEREPQKAAVVIEALKKMIARAEDEANE